MSHVYKLGLQKDQSLAVHLYTQHGPTSRQIWQKLLTISLRGSLELKEQINYGWKKSLAMCMRSALLYLDEDIPS